MPTDSTCEHCGESRRAVLQLVKLGQGRAVLCANCGRLARRLSPRPTDPQDALDRLGRAPWTDGQRRAYRRRQGAPGQPTVDVEAMAAELLSGG